MAVSRKAFNKTDLILIAAVLLAALLIFGLWAYLNKTDGTREGRISVNGVKVMTVDLSKNAVFSVPEKPEVVFEVKDGAVAFKSSNCPDMVCVHTGYISLNGQMAACLPNDIVLSIITIGNLSPDDADTYVS